jgi:hypothetical protein
MDLDDQFSFGHLLFFDRKCRACGFVKNLLDDFYLTRKDRKPLPSAYSYECKECTMKRIKRGRDRKIVCSKWEYPDW